MTPVTHEQRIALRKIYKRIENNPPTYRAFLESVKPTFFCDNAVVVGVWGMFLCIERDGYTHS